MGRYLRLYAHFVRFSFSRAMEFRVDFTFRIVMDVIYYVVNLMFYRVILLHTDALAGWNEPQLMVFVGAFIVVDALNMTIFSNNTWWFPQLINRGDLDYYLVRPVSSFFFVSFRDFAANSFVNLIMASSILAWAIARYPAPLGAAKIALFVALIASGTLLYHLLHMVTLMPVFWTHSARGFEQLFWTCARLMEKPDRIFYGWVRRLFVSILPFSLVASFPARLLFEEFDWTTLAHILVATGAFGLTIAWLWGRGLRSYSSASS